MPSTPRYAFPYPSLADPPDGPKQLGALAESVENTIASIESVVNQQITRRFSGTAQGGEVTFGGNEALLQEDVTLNAISGHVYLVTHTTQATRVESSASVAPFVVWYYRYAEGNSVTVTGTLIQEWIGPSVQGSWTSSTRHTVWTAPSSGNYTIGVSARSGTNDSVRSLGRLTIADVT